MGGQREEHNRNGAVGHAADDDGEGRGDVVGGGVLYFIDLERTVGIEREVVL